MKTCKKCGSNQIAYGGWMLAVYRFYCLKCGEWQASLLPPNQAEIQLGKADRRPHDPDKQPGQPGPKSGDDK